MDKSQKVIFADCFRI